MVLARVAEYFFPPETSQTSAHFLHDEPVESVLRKDQARRQEAVMDVEDDLEAARPPYIHVSGGLYIAKASH